MFSSNRFFEKEFILTTPRIQSIDEHPGSVASRPHYDVAEMRRRLAAHLDWYNHHALGGLLVPADRYYGRVDEVLARIEAGAGRDASGLLDLRERCLELFKVTSQGGIPEVWLLGKNYLVLRTSHRIPLKFLLCIPHL